MAEASITTIRARRGMITVGVRYKWLPFWLLLPSVLILLLLQVGPTLYSLWLSTTRVRAGELQHVGLRNFERLLNTPSFREAIRLTAIYAGSYVIATVLLGLFIALLLNRRIQFTGVYLVLIFIPWVISDVVAGTMWRWLWNPSYGLVQSWVDRYVPFLGEHIYTTATGAMVIVVVAAVWRGLAFTTLVCLGALQTVPHEVIEYAALDGANRFQRFFRIILPLIRPTLVVMVLLASIQAINSVGLIFSITNGGPGGATKTAAFFLLETGWRNGDFGLGAAASLFMFFINLSLSLLYLRLIGRERA